LPSIRKFKFLSQEWGEGLYMKLSKIFVLSLLLVGISLTVIFGVAAHGNQEAVDPEPLNVVTMPHDEQARALMSLATAFAPNIDKAQWIEFACAGMTKGGCDFSGNQPVQYGTVSLGRVACLPEGLVETIAISNTAQFWRCI
jgi:hypothetical protein